MKLNITSKETEGRYIYLNVERPKGFRVEQPGQYTVITCGEVSQHTVVAGTSGREISFIISKDTHLGRELQNKHDAVEIGPIGGGFNIIDLPGRHVVCFAGGSGVAAIKPLLEELEWQGYVKSCKTFYSESDGQWARVNRWCGDVYKFKTEKAMSYNIDEPILGMITKLTNVVPINFPDRPVVFAAGPADYVERLREALVPMHVAEEDFRVNL